MYTNMHVYSFLSADEA